MKFSVLLPTRNGGPYLNNCIDSILDQNYKDIELIISDNANSDETSNILDDYKFDSRVTVLRLENVVSVTDNWNNALFRAKGDYILMMGDDDLLLPGYFTHISALLSKYSNPDCILYNGYSYVAPNSISNHEHSFYSESHFNYGNDFLEEKELSYEQRFGVVRDMFNFIVRIPLNMQTTLVRRDVLEAFYPPFPDHYALNELLITAKSWVFSPQKLLVVGVSPKSFGHYYYGNKNEAGLNYLGINPEFEGMIPGSDLSNGMHMWLNLLKLRLGAKLQTLNVNRSAYIRRQVFAWYMQTRLGALSKRQFLNLFMHLTFADWLRLLASFFDQTSWNRLIRLLKISGGSSAQVQWDSLKPLPNIRNIAQFSDWISKDNS